MSPSKPNQGLPQAFMHVKLLTALQESTWAGQQEQVALARQYGVMIRVYQANQPAWTIKPDFSDFPKVLDCLPYSLQLKRTHAPPALSLTQDATLAPRHQVLQ